MLLRRGPGAVSTPVKEYRHAHHSTTPSTPTYASRLGHHNRSQPVADPATCPSPRLPSGRQLPLRTHRNGRASMSANRLTVTCPHSSPRAALCGPGPRCLGVARIGQRRTAGCTPIDNPGPRWSAYVHALRHECGLDIGTVHEAHAGPFPGNHARYVLNSPVKSSGAATSTQ